MDDSRRRRLPALPLQREFVSSRLEEQILKQAFALVMPVHRLRGVDDEQPKTALDHPQGVPSRSQGVG
jgi:hypothetical protein